jgi:hypothetical protein
MPYKRYVNPARLLGKPTVQNQQKKKLRGVSEGVFYRAAVQNAYSEEPSMFHGSSTRI